MLNKYFNQSLRYRTQKALEIINHQEDYHLHFIESLHSISSSRHIAKQLHSHQWLKIQLLPRISQMYELICPSRIEQFPVSYILKIIVKDFKGSSIHLMASSKPQIVPIERCEYRVSKDLVLRMTNVNVTKDKIYLSMHSTSQLTILKMKYQFIDERSAVKSQTKLQLPQQPIKRYREEINFASELKLKIINNNQRQDYLKSISRIKREELLSASSPSQKQRSLKAKQKLQQIESFKQKSKSLKDITKKCKNLASQYDSHIKSQRSRNSSTVQKLSTMILIIKFMILTNGHTQKLSYSIRKAIKQRIIVKTFIFNMKLQLKKLKTMISHQYFRDLVNIHHFSICSAKVFYKADTLKAQKMILCCLTDVKVGSSINIALKDAMQYRRKIRTIQRYYTTRYNSQMQMLKCYVQRNQAQLMSKHTHFQKCQQQFNKNKMSYLLSCQYLKDSSSKLKILFDTYYSKLQQIQQTKKANQQIKVFNSKSLKKHQKKIMDVPSTPPYPVTRYFRDLSILKSMIRTWFQIQHRKYIKKYGENAQLA